MKYDYKEKFSVEGKHCIVTGGAQGLSRGMAEALLENGCKVVLMDVQEEKLNQVVKEYCDMGYQAYGVCGNLADRSEIDRMFAEAMKILEGRLDVLIPAAGIQRRHLPEEFPIEEWDLVLNINLNHVFIMCQKALQVMLKMCIRDSYKCGQIAAEYMLEKILTDKKGDAAVITYSEIEACIQRETLPL